MVSKKLVVNEIFGPTFQGEGLEIGTFTVFVRLASCDFKCAWCDTLHAVDPIYKDQWHKLTAYEIMEEVQKLTKKKCTITISGGNPALQDLNELLDLGHEMGYKFALETQGSVSKEWFSKLEVLAISPKPPSAKVETKIQDIKHSLKKANITTKTFLKVVIFDELDYKFALDLHKEIYKDFPKIPFILQVGNNQVEPEKDVDLNILSEKLKWLMEKAGQDNLVNVRVLPQLHVYAYGNQRAK